VPADPDDADGLNFLAGLSLATVNRQAFRGTALAHRTGAVPSMTITMPALTPFALGSVLYFFERACALSGYLLGVNPFDQPGVEAYKQNMFALLNKPGYQERAVTVQGAIEANTGKCTITFAQP
jgi:glucose-6-phosphate isomerase